MNKSEGFRDLQILQELAINPSITQRDLGKRIGLALGMVNLHLHRFANLGLIAIVELEKSRIRYLLTPKGMTEKARLTYAYIEYSLYFYRQIRAFLMQVLNAIPPSSGKRILLCGSGEVTEIAFLLLQQNGFAIVGVVDTPQREREVFLAHRILTMAAAAELTFDWVVVASLANRLQMRQELCRVGVPAEKIIAIPEEGAPAFRTAAFSSLEASAT